MSSLCCSDRLTVYVTQGSGNSFKLPLAQLGIAHRLQFVDVPGGERRESADRAGLSLPAFPHVAAWIERVTRTPGFVAIDRLLDPERGKADRTDTLAA